MPQPVLFDLDGTVTDPKEGITKSIQYALGEMGIRVEDLDALCPFIGPPLRDSFMRYYAMDEATAEEAVRLYRVYYRDKGILQNVLYPGMDALLASLHAKGRQVLLATSKPTVFAEQILRHFAIDGYFSFVAGSELDGARSHKDEVIRYALAEQGIQGPAIMVGDTAFDMTGAKKTGLTAVGVLYGYGPEASLREAGADYIVSTVAALERLLLSL